MKKPDKCEDSNLRFVLAVRVQDFVDNIDCMYKSPNDRGVDNLKKYFEDHGIPVPVITDDERKDSTIKNMYRVWASLECNDLMCALNGCE